VRDAVPGFFTSIITVIKRSIKGKSATAKLYAYGILSVMGNINGLPIRCTHANSNKAKKPCI